MHWHKLYTVSQTHCTDISVDVARSIGLSVTHDVSVVINIL